MSDAPRDLSELDEIAEEAHQEVDALLRTAVPRKTPSDAVLRRAEFALEARRVLALERIADGIEDLIETLQRPLAGQEEPSDDVDDILPGPRPVR